MKLTLYINNRLCYNVVCLHLAGSKGDLIIRFEVKYPNTLTQSQKKAVKDALDCTVQTVPALSSCYNKRLPETYPAKSILCPPMDEPPPLC